MGRTSDIETRLRAFLEQAAGRRELPSVAAAWLFGSVAQGTARADSDVDVAVLYGSPPVESFDSGTLRLESEIERVLRRPVEVVALDDAPVDLAIRVLRTGKLLIDRDPARRVEFEVRVRNEFWDLEPILERYRAASPSDRK